MSTGLKIVHGALQRIGAHSPIRPAGPEAIETSKDTLNSMIAMWQDDNIEFGAVPLNAVGDEFSEPLGLTNTVMDNLAILLQPQFPGTQISVKLESNANKGYQDLLTKAQEITIPKQVVRETLPIGQGNKSRHRTFFGPGGEIGD